MLEKGQSAPDFSLPDQDGIVHTLHQYRGKKVLLFFYPKDNTPGCTIEAKGFRDLYDQFQELGVFLLGINTDSTNTHKKFCTKHSLPYPLLSDPDKTTITAYGAKGFLSAKRISYLIDEEGVIMHPFLKVSPSHHPEEILSILKAS
ncbi:MAG: peroxiredoxin [Chlamydiae bacterium]|nr:peroxiredoxin [Chlamydiota bacterium]